MDYASLTEQEFEQAVEAATEAGEVPEELLDEAAKRRVAEIETMVADFVARLIKAFGWPT